MNIAPSMSSVADVGVIRRLADLLKLGGDPTRLALVLALREGAASTADLAEDLGVDRAVLARNLQLLRAAGVVESSRTGGGSKHELTSKGRALLAAVEALDGRD